MRKNKGGVMLILPGSAYYLSDPMSVGDLDDFAQDVSQHVTDDAEQELLLSTARGLAKDQKRKGDNMQPVEVECILCDQPAVCTDAKCNYGPEPHCRRCHRLLRSAGQFIGAAVGWIVGLVVWSIQPYLGFLACSILGIIGGLAVVMWIERPCRIIRLHKESGE